MAKWIPTCRIVLVVVLLLGLLPGLAGKAGGGDGPLPTAPPPAPPPHPSSQLNAPPLKMLSPGVFEIGGCRILKNSGEVEFPAIVNMEKGLLEYLIVTRSGKVHESLLRTDVEPYSLQVALLLLGLEGTLQPLPGQGADETPQGERVSISVRWKQDGKQEESRIEQWVAKGKDSVGQIPWVFTGSMIIEGVFMAQVEKSIVAVFHDPTALIDHQLQEGASDEVWFVNEEKVPSVGTEVTVIIGKRPKGSKI